MASITSAVTTVIAAAGAAAGRDARTVVTPPPAGVAGVSLALLATIAGGRVGGIAAEVTAPDLTGPIASTLPVADGVATGRLVIPSGEARTVTLRAFDPAGVETHRGARTIVVLPGPNSPVTIVLLPHAGGAPIEAMLGSVIVTLTPAALLLRVGESAALTATVTGSDGHVILSPPLRWVTLAARVTTLGAAGRVMAHEPGETKVVAIYEHYAGSATVTVIG